MICAKCIPTGLSSSQAWCIHELGLSSSTITHIEALQLRKELDIQESKNKIAQLDEQIYQKKMQLGLNKVGTKHIITGTTAGTKNDTEKNRLDLLPTEALEEIAKVLTFGAKKYADYNWTKGFVWSRLLGATLRHLFAFMRGEDKDPESGISHLAHAGCCILFLLYHEKHHTDLDNRHKTG